MMYRVCEQVINKSGYKELKEGTLSECMEIFTNYNKEGHVVYLQMHDWKEGVWYGMGIEKEIKPERKEN